MANLATFGKELLSASSNGQNIKVAAVATPGTLLHTTAAGTNHLDEVWLWATNTSASNVKLTLEWGGVTAPDDLVEVTVPSESGLVLVIPGWLLNNALLIRAFAASADVININGYVNRITAG